MCSSSPRRCLATAAAAAFALVPSGMAASHHRRSVPPFQIQPTHQLSAKTMSGIPSLSWPNALANETYTALGLEMPIVGIAGSNPELIFLGAESYLLFTQAGMTMNAYNNLNISDNLLSSSLDPLVSFNEPSSIFSDSPFSSSSGSGDLRLLAVLLYKQDTQTQSAAKKLSSSSEGVLSDIVDLLEGDTKLTEGFDWDGWAADMNANPALRMDFDISDFAMQAGLGKPVAAEVLMVKDEAELTDSLDVSESWDIVSTLYQTGAAGHAAGTATGTAPAASDMATPASGVRWGPSGLGLMPSGMGAGIGRIPSGAVSGSGLGFGAAAATAAAAVTGSPLTSTGPDVSDTGSEGTGAGSAAASGSSGQSAGGSGYMKTSPSGLLSFAAGGGSSSGGLVVVPVASSNSALGAASTGSPMNSTTAVGTSENDSNDSCDDDGSGSVGAGVRASGALLASAAGPTRAGAPIPSGLPKQPKYLFPQFSGAAGGVPSLVDATAVIGQAPASGTTPIRSAAEAGITGGGNAAAPAALEEQMTVGINIDGEYATTITANLKYRDARRRTADARPGWTLTLKTDLVAPTPTPTLVKMAETTASTVVPTSTPYSVPRYVYRRERSTLLTMSSALGSPKASGSSAVASSFMTTSSAVSGTMLLSQALFVLGSVCVSFLVVSFL